MRHRRAGRKLSRTTEHRRAMLRNMATDFFRLGKIHSTDIKVKELRRFAEKLITLAKQGTLHARRRAAADIQDKEVLKKLFEEIAPHFKLRPGGYTRIVKLGFRRGDNAPISLIKLVEEEYEPEPEKKKRSKAKAGAKAEQKTEAALETEPSAQESPIEEGASEAEEQPSEKKPKRAKSSKVESAEELGLIDAEGAPDAEAGEDPAEAEAPAAEQPQEESLKESPEEPEPVDAKDVGEQAPTADAGEETTEEGEGSEDGEGSENEEEKS